MHGTCLLEHHKPMIIIYLMCKVWAVQEYIYQSKTYFKIKAIFLTVPTSAIPIPWVLWNCFCYSQHSSPLSVLKSMLWTLLQSLKSHIRLFCLWRVPASPLGQSFESFCLWVKFYSHPLSESPQSHTLKYSGWRDLPAHVSGQKRTSDPSPKGWSHAWLPHCTAAAAVQVGTSRAFRGPVKAVTYRATFEKLRGMLTKPFRTQLSTLSFSRNIPLTLLVLIKLPCLWSKKPLICSQSNSVTSSLSPPPLHSHAKGVGFLLCSEENWVRPRVIQCLRTPSPWHPCRASKCHGSEKRCLTQGMWPATVTWYLAETVAPIQSVAISIPKLIQPKERKSFYNPNGARIAQKAPSNYLLSLFYFYSSMPTVGIHRDPFWFHLHYQESKKQTVSAT